MIPEEWLKDIEDGWIAHSKTQPPFVNAAVEDMLEDILLLTCQVRRLMKELEIIASGYDSNSKYPSGESYKLDIEDMQTRAKRVLGKESEMCRKDKWYERYYARRCQVGS